MTLAQSQGFAVEEALSPQAGTSADTAARLSVGSLQVRREVDGAQVRLQLEAMTPCEPQGFPISLDYWEVDFNYQPPVFRSTSQAARPWRRGLAPLSLSHRYPQRGTHRAKVRAVCASGETAEAEIPIEV
jgi:hypothetical protein